LGVYNNIQDFSKTTIPTIQNSQAKNIFTTNQFKIIINNKNNKKYWVFTIVDYNNFSTKEISKPKISLQQITIMFTTKKYQQN
jgi:hypothetical protein